MTDLAAFEAKIDELANLVLRSNPPQFMTTEECAAFLKVSAERLYQMRKEGGGPPFCQPTARWVRYRLSDVEAWMNEQAE